MKLKDVLSLVSQTILLCHIKVQITIITMNVKMLETKAILQINLITVINEILRYILFEEMRIALNIDLRMASQDAGNEQMDTHEIRKTMVFVSKTLNVY